MTKKKQSSKKPVNVGFADQYKGCQVVANIMGLNVETVRKKAKAGTIPAKQDGNGTWIFTHADLLKAGVKPFTDADHPNPSTPKTAGPLPLKQKVNVTDVIFVLDRSGSMGGLMTQARKNLQAQLDQLKRAAGPHDVYNVTVINFDDTVLKTLSNVDVTLLQEGAHSLYRDVSGSTALFDAIGAAIFSAESLEDGRAHLISVITDGGENASRDHSQYSIANKVQRLTSRGNYTFVYAGPRYSDRQATSLGFSAGNITMWDQTDAGIRDLGLRTNSGLESYTSSRSVGIMSSKSFYAQPVTADASKFAQQVSTSLDDVTTRIKVERVSKGDPVVINKFCEKKFGAFTKGKHFYELIESEKVQDYKEVIIQDKTTGKFYRGRDSAKQLLGIPSFAGTVHIKPGNLGEYKAFVQSTSYNRKLNEGTAVLTLS